MNDISIFDKLKRTVELLKQEDCTFALAGGILVSAYRDDVRLTNDIDLLLLYKNESSAKAEKILSILKLTPRFVKLHDLKRAPRMNKKSAPSVIIVGRAGELEVGVDFILPDMPWFDAAIKRSQLNLIDFGFGEIPCLTVEDMFISKIFAGRDKDIDDLKSMLRKGNVLDIPYLAGEILRLELFISKDLNKLLPKSLSKIIRKRKNNSF